MSLIPAGTAFVTHARDRQQLLWTGRTVFDIVLGGEATGNTLALLEQRGERGDVTPMHTHRGEAEVFYVVEGGVAAWAGEQLHHIDSGGAVYLPPGQPHALGIRTPQARVITLTVPAGFAEFVREAGMPIVGDVPQTWDFDLERVMTAAGRHDIEIVGPPPQLPTD